MARRMYRAGPYRHTPRGGHVRAVDGWLSEDDKVTRWQGDKVREETSHPDPVTLSPGHLVTLSSAQAEATGAMAEPYRSGRAGPGVRTPRTHASMDEFLRGLIRARDAKRREAAEETTVPAIAGETPAPGGAPSGREATPSDGRISEP